MRSTALASRGGRKTLYVGIPHIAVFFADLYFRELLTGANFATNIFTIRPKPDHTHVGALREEGVAPKISRNIILLFSRLAEIRENKCLRKNPAIYTVYNYI